MNSSAPFDVHSTIGVLEIGVRIADILFGIMSLQTYIYFRDYPADSRRLKALVGFIWFCGLGQTICTWHTLYNMTVTDFGVVREKPPSSLFVAWIFGASVGPVVQAFFANRVHKISREIVIPMTCWILSSLRFLTSMAIIIGAFRMVNLREFQSQARWLIATGFSLGCCVDIIVTASVCYYLRRERSNSIKQTARLLDRLIKWTIQTGMITCLTGIAGLVCFFTMHNAVYIALFLILSRLFTHSLLVTLNARVQFRNVSDSTMQPNTPDPKLYSEPEFRAVSEVLLEMLHSSDSSESSDPSSQNTHLSHRFEAHSRGKSSKEQNVSKEVQG